MRWVSRLLISFHQAMIPVHLLIVKHPHIFRLLLFPFQITPELYKERLGGFSPHKYGQSSTGSSKGQPSTDPSKGQPSADPSKGKAPSSYSAHSSASGVRPPNFMIAPPKDWDIFWIGGPTRNKTTGKYDDADLAKILQDATDHPASAFKARGYVLCNSGTGGRKKADIFSFISLVLPFVSLFPFPLVPSYPHPFRTPHVMRIIEWMAIEQNRTWVSACNPTSCHTTDRTAFWFCPGYLHVECFPPSTLPLAYQTKKLPNPLPPSSSLA